MLGKSELAVIHIAKTELKLKEDDYRYILQSNFKKDSSKNLNKIEFLKLMEIFEKLGYKKKRAKKSDNATKSQIKKIKELEELLGWKDSPERLEGFIVRQTGHKSKKEWLSVTDAQKVIEGMKRMVGRKSP
jgi:phage gp16-like protein